MARLAVQCASQNVAPSSLRVVNPIGIFEFLFPTCPHMDIFDVVLDLESRLIEEGREEGLREGIRYKPSLQ